jgi:hypothetical protein
MVRIGVLSDTHLSDDAGARRFLHSLAERHFAGVDLILHAGDIVVPELLVALAPYPVCAVRGNMDAAACGLPYKRIVTVAGVRIGLIHGWGPAGDLVPRLLGEFPMEKLDALVFGHTHEPMCRREGGLLLFNPGSATQRRRMPHTSVGLLEIDAGRIAGKIIQLDRVEALNS